MKEERYFYAPDAATGTELPQEEAVHATRVLRLTEGDTMYLMDGQGTFYEAEVTMTSGKRCAYTIRKTLPQQRAWRGHIHLAMAPTKMMERVEWMAEKATEIGIDELSFLECQFSERRKMREDRVEKIVVAAMKQSRKAWLPTVNAMCPFKAFIEQQRPGRKFICHCYDEIERQDLFNLLRTLPTGCSDSDGMSSATDDAKTSANSEGMTSASDDVTILIGPEGDFSIDEVRLAMQHGYQSVSLGTSRLRTETAAMAAIMQAQLSQR